MKIRDARYSNLKVLLIFLVVYGHLIESYIGQSTILMEEYRWIYLVHMPLFSFLAGLFLKNQDDCMKQIKKLLPLYLVIQIFAVVCRGDFNLMRPYWHLWYLLSYCMWAALAWLWFRFGKDKGKWIILAASIVMGCLAGYVSWVGREMSLSRTITFFPYFWMGVLAKSEYQWKKWRIPGVVALTISIVLVVLWGKQIPVTFLYQAESFGDLAHGSWLRLLCYIIGTLLGLFLLTIMPDKQYVFTKLGDSTLLVYLAHIPVILALRKVEIPFGLFGILSGMMICIGGGCYALFRKIYISGRR